MASKPYKAIEYPSQGQTYCRMEYGVYEYSTYPRSSVLAGSQRRVFLDSYKTLEEAKKAHPDAKEAGCGHIDVNAMTAHLPGDDDPDPFGDYDPNDY